MAAEIVGDGIVRISDEEVLQDMLRVRYQHAIKQPINYSHLFRRKRRWELVRLSMIIAGIEFCYAAETGFVSPILLSIGLSHTFMTMIWAFSPVVGFFFSPMVASFSDQLQCSWGRRRPILLVLGIGLLLGLLILPHGKAIGIFFGDDDVSADEASGFRWAIPVTIVSLVLIDFDAETSNGIARAYCMDMCTLSDQTRILTTAMIVGGLGGTAGYLLGAVDWRQTFLGDLLGSNEATLFAMVFVAVLVGLVLTLTSYREIPYQAMKEDALLRPVTTGMLDAEKLRRIALFSISGEVSEVQKTQTAIPLTDEDEKPLSLKDFAKNMTHMPKSLLILYSTQFLSHLGYLSFCLYFTDFVGAEVFGGDVMAPPGSPELALYDEGVRYGCWGMAVFTVCSAGYSVIIESLIKRFSARPVYIGGLLVFSLGMLLMALVREKFVVFIACPTVGIMYATIYSIPYLMVSHYHSKNSFAMKDGKCIESTQRRGFGADVSVISSMLFLAQLVISLAIGSVIDAVQSNTVVIFSASLFSSLAALCASQVLYMGL